MGLIEKSKDGSIFNDANNERHNLKSRERNQDCPLSSSIRPNNMLEISMHSYFSDFNTSLIYYRYFILHSFKVFTINILKS